MTKPKFDSDQIAANVYRDIEEIRKQNPLIHNLTNFVVMQTTANALLALGASPVMAHAEKELSDIINIARSLVINIGTLDEAWISSMDKAMALAKARNIPIVIDPVGVGASELRTTCARKLIGNNKPTVIRGNASEIYALVYAGKTRGVDSIIGSEEAVRAAETLVKQHDCVVVISGATDICVADNFALRVHNGSPLMAKVTGMGCTATAIIAAFCAVNSDPFWASLHAMVTMGIVGELAAASARGPGSMMPAFFDELYSIKEEDITWRINVG